jgi:hypothetical protein
MQKYNDQSAWLLSQLGAMFKWLIFLIYLLNIKV